MNGSPRQPAAWRLGAIAAALLVAGCASLGGGEAPKRPVDLQAHRGGRALAPENTLAAFTNAIAMGVNTLELDIGLTADDVVVISHDMALNPDHTRDAKGFFLRAKGPAIRSMPLAQLQTYDVGRIDPTSDYAKPFPKQLPHDGERIPTLTALFERVHALGADQVRFNIETKVDPSRASTGAPSRSSRSRRPSCRAPISPAHARSGTAAGPPDFASRTSARRRGWSRRRRAKARAS